MHRFVIQILIIVCNLCKINPIWLFLSKLSKEFKIIHRGNIKLIFDGGKTLGFTTLYHTTQLMERLHISCSFSAKVRPFKTFNMNGRDTNL